MALDGNDANLDKIDPELKEFIVNEQIKTQIQAQIRKLNTLCFEKCVEKAGNSENDQTFHLIRLPKETVQRCLNGSGKVGSVYVYDNGQAEFQDDKTHKVYTLLRNSQSVAGQGSSSHQTLTKKEGRVLANEESDIFKVSLVKDEAVHLGKVKLSTLLAVPKVDEKDVSTVFG